MRIAKGEYILLLNPDTYVQEDTFLKCIAFMDQHPNAGGLGVRMIDGKGNFLPESKRGLPTPIVAFYKIFGLSRIFPRSKRFGRYHLGYLDEFETNEIEILSGAYMFMRKKALDEVGLLDEAFFMYGEDIDLSYRIVKGGYKNYYYPKTQIIHYKGESTKKSSINYVFVFYKAMIIFAKKHFSNKNAQTFSFLINLAIYFRAGLAILNRFIKKSALPIFDFITVLITLWGMASLWGKESHPFPSEVLRIDLPIYSFLWCISIYISGGYDRPIKIFNLLKGVATGTAVILIFYALLPKELQFSRLFILLGTLGVASYFVLFRLLLHFLIKGKFDLGGIRKKTFAIIGSPEERNRVEKILKSSINNIQALHYISTEDTHEADVSGSVNQLDQVVHIHGIDEVIFCARDNSAETIIRWMSKIASDELEFKIAQPDSLHLIGSNSIDTSGDLYFFQIDKIQNYLHLLIYTLM
jgi:GT2 family glycosyltransferase